MPAEFRELPAQALPACLVGVQPCSAGWGSAAAKALLALTGHSDERGVLALVTGRSSAGMEVWLVDTVRNDLPEGVWINDALVARGLARFCGVGARSMEAVVKPRLKALVREALAIGDVLYLPEAQQSVTEMSSKIEDFHAMVQAVQGEESLINKTSKPFKTSRLKVAGVDGCETAVTVVLSSGRVWVEGREVSGLVPEWRGWHLLEARLRARGLHPDTRRVEEGEEGWSILVAGGVVEQGQREVVLYRLDTLPLVLGTISQRAATVLASLWSSINDRI